MKLQRLTALLALLAGLVVLAFELSGMPQTGMAPPATSGVATSGVALAAATVCFGLR